jgi:hypothetical protein
MPSDGRAGQPAISTSVIPSQGNNATISLGFRRGERPRLFLEGLRSDAENQANFCYEASAGRGTDGEPSMRPNDARSAIDATNSHFVEAFIRKDMAGIAVL